MAEQHSVQIPWASLIVVATFVSGTLIVPQAFDLLRPAEKDRAQALAAAPLEVDARLWEDPFVAARRHEDERQQRCQKEKERLRDTSASAAATVPMSRDCHAAALALRRSAEQLRARLDRDGDRDLDEVLVVAVLVPGNPFVGAEESRRRTRSAVIAGLQAERYMPDDAERIGLLDIGIPQAREARSGEPPDRLLVPYELLSDRKSRRTERIGRDKPVLPAPPADAASAPATQNYLRVLVLWIDETALPAPKLDKLAFVVQAVVGDRKPAPQLALIGPPSSEGLRHMLVRLDELERLAMQDPTNTRHWPSDAELAGYRLLANARMFNNASTVAKDDLSLGNAEPDVGDFMRQRLAGIVGTTGGPVKFEFHRTIGTDDRLMDVLARELEQRLPPDRSRRIVLITESDSLHARSLERGLRNKVASLRKADRPEDRIFFFRGIDGVTVRDGNERRLPDGPRPDASRPAIEWPESRDQLDYLRRVAQELQRSETVAGGDDGRAHAIGAIGIFASDVHDKLLILQALHETFPDKVFFTTDMDARLLHPRTLPFTRNLIVASSLPLQFPIQRQKAPPPEPTPGLGFAVAATADVPASAASRPRQLHAGTAPFRDVYQAATFVAARLAACGERCADVQKQANAATDAPSVYEIGRSGAIPLLGLDLMQRRAFEPVAGYRVGLFTMVLLMAGGLLVWPSTPTLRAARDPSAALAAGSARRLLVPAFVATYGAILGATLASVIEVLGPGQLGLRGVALWSALGGLTALGMHPGVIRPGLLHGRSFALASMPALVTFTTLLVVLAWVSIGRELPFVGEPMAWAQGVSGWPSHFINLLAVAVGVVALDHVGSMLVRSREADDRWLALPPPEAPAAARDAAARLGEGVGWSGRWRERAAGVIAWIWQHSLLGWQSGRLGEPVDFAALWPQYHKRSALLPRLLRIAFWWAVTLVTVLVLFLALSDNDVPEVPVRGLEHRRIVTAVLVVALLLLPLVVVAVADATMLCWRLIRGLSAGRTVYPPQTVDRFAAELGPVHRALWSRSIAADPAQRHGNGHGVAAPHSLLDDWIDMQIVARRTKVIAPLVLPPFVMIALLVLARSRLFDNWALTWPIAAAIALYVIWLGLLAALLKKAAEDARRRALTRMNADLRWLAGAGPRCDVLVEPMRRLITTVESSRIGAFAPLLDQWFFKALMVPLGSAGGAQLLDRLLTAR